MRPVEDDPALAETHTPQVSGTNLIEAESAATLVASAASSERPIDADLAFDTSDEGRYESGPLLGRGGMGEVTLQLDRRIGRPIAKKTLRAELQSSDAAARFIREGRVQGQLEHPSVVPVYDLGRDGESRVFFTMKRVRGQTLAFILDRLAQNDPEYVSRYTRRKLLAAFVQVCLAVEYAHSRGVIHRDLKPGNLMLGDFGEVYVLDWGIAKLRGDATSGPTELPVSDGASGEFTHAGDVLGTPQYMAPEQMTHQAPIDARADVFTLGAILFELLTLTPYRNGESMPKILAQAARSDVELPSERVPGIPPELDRICKSALASDHASRTSSALSIADDLERFLEGDRDLAMRRAEAKRLLDAARTSLEGGGAEHAETRVQAMRRAMKALALVPEDEDAQRLLLSLVVDGSGRLPEEAEREFAEGDNRVRLQGAQYGIAGYALWLLSLPLALWAGVRYWPFPIALTALTVVCLLYAAHQRRRGARSVGHSLGLAALSFTVISLSSAWLGPFVLTPVAGCATAIMFVVHCTKRERPWLLAIASIGAIAPFVVELLGLAPPAYSFRAGELVLHARSLELTPVPTILALVYTSISFLVLIVFFVGRVRDKQREAERHLFVQAWHLRQLFPTRT